MKLTASLMVSLDGVYQGPGGPDEDRGGGFDRGGWTSAFGSEAGWQWLLEWFGRADALLLGRKTFDIWEPYWPQHDGGDAVSHGINVLPKYVPSTTRRESEWQNTHFLSGDVEAQIRALKGAPGRELQLHGSGDLLRWLLDHDLVDELNLRVYPVILGDGRHLFPDKGQPHRLDLVEVTSLPEGVMLQTFRPNGRPTYATVGAE
jgi:dihydrofolate reductase